MSWRTPTARTPGARDERFSKTVETGRWWRGAPEAIKAMVVEHQGTLLLGLAKLNRRSQGHTSAFGKRKPQKFQQSTRTLYYNLADDEHVHALLHTFRHLGAYAAALEQNRRDRRYCLKIGQRRVLSRALLQLDNDSVESVKYDGHEVLEILCENGNYRNPSNQVLALDPEIRARARDRWRAQCTPRERVTFRIRRTLNTADEELRGFALNNASELEIPLEAAAGVVDAIRVVLQYLWAYLNRHPLQASRRHEGSRKRWQLHRLDAVDRLLIPQLDDALVCAPEHALFFERELYDRAIPRLQPDGTFDPRHLRRLAAYEAGDLRWSSQWTTTEWEALNDIAALQQEDRHQRHQQLLLMLRVSVLLLALKRRRRQATVPPRLRPRQEQLPPTSVCSVEHRSRGPPWQPP